MFAILRVKLDASHKSFWERAHYRRMFHQREGNPMTDQGKVIPFPSRFMHEPWLSKKQIAAYFGYSVRWVEMMVREGMPCERIGSRLRFRISDVEPWVQRRAQRLRTPGRRPGAR